MDGYRGSCCIGSVLFSWQYIGESTDNIEVKWLDSIIVDECLPLPDSRNPLVFSVQDPTDSRRQVRGELRFEDKPPRLVVTFLSYPGGRGGPQVLFPDRNPEPLPIPASGSDAPPEVAMAVERPPESDLFPYLYLAQWPGITAQDLANRFVQYDGESAPEDSLYRELLEARSKGRHAMVHQADLFLEGRPPYTGQNLTCIDVLGAPMNQLSMLDEKFRINPPQNLDEFKHRTEIALEMDWAGIQEYWKSDSYSGRNQQCWQNVFALAVQTGFDRELTDQLLRTLALGCLITRIIESEPDFVESGAKDSDEAQPITLERLWTQDQLEDGSNSTVVLPGTIFPLPNADSTAGNTVNIGPVPYAIGDLKLVRKCLRRYELGEISRIENVMRGEFKESSEKHLRESKTEEMRSETRNELAEQEISGKRQDLLAETLNALKEKFHYHYESQYGPPATQLTVIVDEKNKPIDDEPQKKNTVNAVSAARLLTQRAAGSMASRLHRQRLSSSLNRDEICTVRRIDASHMEKNIRAVYRWVNKVYQCWTVSLGKRFVLEFFVPNPAQAYIAGLFSLRGLSLNEPPPLVNFGVKTFQDISDDPESPAYYAKLAAEYEVHDLQPPPERYLLNSVDFQGGEPICRQPIPIAPDYRAVSARVAVFPAPGDENLRLCINVGQQRYDYPDTETGSWIVELELDGQTGQVPVAVLTTVGGSSVQPLSCYSVAVEVKAEISDYAMAQWRISVFNSISRGCARQRKQYYETVGDWPQRIQQSSPLETRDIVRNELRRDILRQLIKHAERLTGENVDILLGRQRYVQFLERALAWTDMAYSFTVKTEDDVGTSISQQYRGENDLFSVFLQAGLARVLLPVTPDFAHRILYFLACGQIWIGADTLTPALFPEEEGKPDYHYINLFNALKEAGDEREVGLHDSWELVVPTDMTVLQETSDLPVFSGDETCLATH